MKLQLFFVSLILSAFLFAQDKPAYLIYTKEGKRTSYEKMLKQALKKKVIFFGELHDNPIAHWLQYEMMGDLYQKHGQNLVCGSEMYEQDNQDVLDSFLLGKINEKQFKESCRLWTNQKTDYQAMLDFAKSQESPIPWIATNIPRRYASLVFKKGIQALDTISASEKEWICPLPFPLDTTLSQYKALSDGEMHMGPNFVLAQAIKDATMGYFISQQLKTNTIFYHLNGAYHSDFFQGIMWYVNYYTQIELNDMFSISTVLQADIMSLDKEYLGKADFIICVPETMTSTH